MNFQDLIVVERPAAYLEHALKQGRLRATQLRAKGRRADPLQRARALERERLNAIAASLSDALLKLPESFPNIDALPEFYVRLIEATLEPERVKGSLASVSTAARNIRELARELGKTLISAPTKEALATRKRQALGRVSSVVKRLEKELAYLDKARKRMRTFPSIKPGLFTVCIAGFPNVGKSTLLSKVTPSRPKIDAYAFTTKTLNVGYLTHRHNKLQLIDTPGTLARPERMNDVERQAYLAIQYAAELIVYVYDLTEQYPLAEQEALEAVVRASGKEVLVYLSKRDILPRERIEAFLAKRPDALISIDGVKARITEIFEKEHLGR